ncbi:MAG: orotate phosphoribosyltransferase [Candidatus Latescibacterota bacterium]
MTKTIEEFELQLGRLIALQLWELGAIEVNLAEPFRLVSGNYSPLYINCRRLISAPAFVDLFSASARIICDRRGVTFDVIAGGETAGIPFAAFLARAFARPLVYVRKKAKSHGIASRIEGTIRPGDKVLLVEDLITDAGSKLSFIEAIQESGGTVEDVLVVFDRLQGGREALHRHGIRLHSIADIDTALAVAEEIAMLSHDVLASIREYLANPAAWHQDRGLPYCN